ncbi:MAG TPA: DUF1501 domain-containing protein [Gemmataceae bacterium]|jgi:hypothetical protein|nr:DUF1501 domain-containing protein [Gemmataceae bacterium]
MFGLNNPLASRRDLLRLAAAGFAAQCAAPWFNVLAARAANVEATGVKPKSCILVWMIGGPPQTLTWDIKSHSPFKAIQTAAPGVQISENFAKTAKVMKDVSLIRGMRTADSNHGSARYLMHTGFRKGQNAVTHPTLGSIVAKQLGDPASDLPNFISVGSPQFVGYGAGHLGPKFAPIRVDDLGTGLTDLKPHGSLAEFDTKRSLLDEMNAAFLTDHMATSVQAHQVTIDRASRLMHTPKTKAFDLSAEPAKVKEEYGSSRLGQSMMLARRLVESGVKFVEVRQGGWDVHKNTAPTTKKLSEEFDTPFAALIADLKTRGMLDSTLVIAMGEFGRNPANGSNHFSRAWTTVLAGGGLKNGQAIGDTGGSGGTVEKHPTAPGDFMATVCKALGIDYTKEWQTGAGRPVPMVTKGAVPVAELFG